ncbi:uncharacterized protein N7529_004496 [Penicillium soppii]|uniref:uncharacterized protein n=1 Tax=Penicillium soppii TaxID=69789 RepID=UPI002548DF31|nr:uncharacterized protein N7529_004496 [Penicillium soppii]KAJ5872143.1 hypothetical protein N7529_004496 [Penicillium soppii]
MAFRCDTCKKAFRNRGPCEQHMATLGHKLPQIKCQGCISMFNSQENVEAHMDERNHWLWTCKECGEHFDTSLYLEMHLASNVHRPHHHECPFCFESFVTPSAVVHHLESTCCEVADWLDIKHLFGLIKDLDPDNLLTIRGAAPKEKEKNPPIRFNGKRFQCHRCDRSFMRQAGLEAHHESPFHDERLYHCLNCTENCGKEFVSLAALFNHLESESCGIMWFEDLEHLHNQLKRAILCKHIITPATLAV